MTARFDEEESVHAEIISVINSNYTLFVLFNHSDNNISELQQFLTILSYWYNNHINIKQFLL